MQINTNKEEQTNKSRGLKTEEEEKLIHSSKQTASPSKCLISLKPKATDSTTWQHNMAASMRRGPLITKRRWVSWRRGKHLSRSYSLRPINSRVLPWLPIVPSLIIIKQIAAPLPECSHSGHCTSSHLVFSHDQKKNEGLCEGQTHGWKTKVRGVDVLSQMTRKMR